MEVVILRFDAPLMSFGGVVVDQHNKTDRFPYRAMLAGLVANALGLSRLETEAFGALQARLRYAARVDRAGEMLVDYQTVDLGQPAMSSALAWTTRGELEERKGGEASDGTHIRFRHYLADAVLTVALTLDPLDGEPSLEAVSDALRSPARPLFLGRKCCVPSGPVWLARGAASSLRSALETTPRLADQRRAAQGGRLPAVWPITDGEEPTSHLWARVEDRDPHNAIHVGRRVYVEGTVDPPRVVARSAQEEGP